MSREFVSFPGPPSEGFGAVHYVIVDSMNDPKLCVLENGDSILRPEVMDWLNDNTPGVSISQTGGTSLIIFKGDRDASLFKLFWF